ncbi:MAG: FtsX-like permease family protein [Acidimicrobiales bacterium]|jgi:putative ABC transport system permease protein
MSSAKSGGVAARRAVLRWSLRLFRREWRQQVLITLLVAAAVAATILGAGVISGGQVPQNAGFGSANELAQLSGSDPHLGEELSALRAHFGALGIIEAEPVSTGTVHGATLESLAPHGPYVGPLVQLIAGRYPTGRDDVDLSSDLAQLYGVEIGGTWVADGTRWRVVGEVRAPTNLNEPFALAAPGALVHPTTVTALFDATPSQLATFSPPKSIYSTLVSAIASPEPPPALNVGELLVLIAAAFGMLFIGLVAVAGFSVMANRRTRAIGMLGAIGAPESAVRLALLVNGVVVGAVAMVLGGAVGLIAWWTYAPHQEQSVGHVVDPAGIAWWLVAVALLLAPITTMLAARRPARSISRLPVVTALSGRPTEPQVSRRNAIVGAGVLAGGIVIVFAGGAAARGGGSGAFVVILGIAATCVGLFLVAQWVIGQLGLVAGRLPTAPRIALRDLSRYRSRSGAALGAICLALLVAGVVVVAATARYSDPFDWVGPNLSRNVVFVYPPNGYVKGQDGSFVCSPQEGCTSAGPPAPRFSVAQFAALARDIGSAIGAKSVLPLEQATAQLSRTTSGRGFTGNLYVATPALLKYYGIPQSSISPTALVLTSRPGLPAVASQLAIAYGAAYTNPNFDNGNAGPCPPGYCVPDPEIQEVSQLPTGTSAPNTVFTMYAVHKLHLTLSVQTWELTTPRVLTSTQKQTARAIAAAAGTSIETANSFVSLDEVLAWALAASLLLALGVLAMTVGLIRAETSSELRVLTAAGAGRRTRRALTSATAGTLGFVGAVLGVATAYLVVLAYLFTSSVSNVQELTYNVPLRPLGVMLLGLPLLAALGGWLFAGREPRGISRQPIE